MLQIEFAKIFEDEVAARWSRCNFSRLDIADWFAAFGSVGPEEFAAAIQAHRIEDEPARPKIIRVRAILRRSTDVGGYQEPAKSGKEVTCQEYYSRLVKTGSVADRLNAWRVSEAYRKMDPKIGRLARGEIDESQIEQPEQPEKEAELCLDGVPW